MRRLSILFLFPAFILFGFSSDVEPDEKEVKKAIPLGGAKVLNTKIEFPVGNLGISTVSTRTTKGVFKFHREKWEPEINYDKENGEGYLRMSSEGSVSLDIGEPGNRGFDDDDQSDWKVVFPREVPHDLDVEMLAGNGDIDLEGSRLEEFEFSMKAGEVKINLRNTSVPDVEFKAIAGNATIDFSGKWRNDLRADIRGGFGSITLRLPEDMGVELEVHGILGQVDAPGMKRDHHRYTNKLFGETRHRLYLDVSGGIGDVEVEWVGD
jgi:hypothetical protein